MVYSVEKSKVEIDLALLLLFNLLTASVTGLLFCTTQKVFTPVKNLYQNIYHCKIQSVYKKDEKLMLLPEIKALSRT